MNTPEPLDVLAVAAHPDDAEISAGGTLLRFAERGLRVGVLDLTRGEMGTRGSREQRAQEAERASAVLGLAWRGNLDLPDGRLVNGIAEREALAAVIRAHRPRLVLAHHTEDLHPDHVAAGLMSRAAWYLSGLARLAEMGDGPQAHRPARILHFQGHLLFDPTMVMDISAVWERKVEAIRCFASQLEARSPSPEAGSREEAADTGAHFLFGSDILARAETKARFWGEKIGVAHGEPLLHIGPLPADDALGLG